MLKTQCIKLELINLLYNYTPLLSDIKGRNFPYFHKCYITCNDLLSTTFSIFRSFYDTWEI